MTASLPEFVYGPVTGLLQTLRDLYNLYFEIQEEKRETLMEVKGNCINFSYTHAGWFIQAILSCTPDDSGQELPLSWRIPPGCRHASSHSAVPPLAQCPPRLWILGITGKVSCPPQATAINNLNTVGEWTRIKNGTAQSLSLYILNLQAESKIRHLIGSNNLKHLQDQRINLFFCRIPPDSLTSYLVLSLQ